MGISTQQLYFLWDVYWPATNWMVYDGVKIVLGVERAVGAEKTTTKIGWKSLEIWKHAKQTDLYK